MITTAERDTAGAERLVGVAEGQRVEAARGRVAAAGPREETDVCVVPLGVGVAGTKRAFVSVPR
jgi:hypothetical protein